MSFQIKEPVLVVGLGGAGSRLAGQAADRLGADILLISNDQTDLDTKNSIMISTAPIINPSVQLIRGSSHNVHDKIVEKISNYATVLMMANLAGRAGAALAPTISQICKNAEKTTISFAIMPFRYEKSRIFDSGLALKRLRENSSCTVIMDNDALLENNPNQSLDSCVDIANGAILHIAGSLKTSRIDTDANILTTGTSPDMEKSLKDSLKMLYGEVPPNSIKHTILYVSGSNIPVGILDSVAKITNGLLGEKGSVDMEMAEVGSNVVMLSTVSGTTKFDSYDPLGAIPQENTMDWAEPEVSIKCDLDLYQLE